MSEQPSVLELAVRKFIYHRSNRAAMKKDWEARDAAELAEMDKIKILLLRKLDSLGAESLRVESGIIVSTNKRTPTCGDWTAFLDWCYENRRLDLLQKRLATTQLNDDIEIWVAEAKKTQKGELDISTVLPPGIALMNERDISIRKA